MTVFLLFRFSLLPQGTTYQKTNAEIEMKRINREEFWEQAKVEIGFRHGCAHEEDGSEEGLSKAEA